MVNIELRLLIVTLVNQAPQILMYSKKTQTNALDDTLPFQDYVAGKLIETQISQFLKRISHVSTDSFIINVFDHARKNVSEGLSLAYLCPVLINDLDLKLLPGTIGVGFYPTDRVMVGIMDQQIIEEGLELLQRLILKTNLISWMLPAEFTLTDMQKSIENILGEELDKRNFRKKIFLLDLVEPTENFETADTHRPARLYRFKNVELFAVDMI